MQLQRIFGLRYFEAYNKRQQILEPLEGEENAINIDSERPLTKTEKDCNTRKAKQFAGGEIALEEYQSKLMS
ncbi:hypothetical protein NDR85_06865 [Bacillus halotolerans]|nr:hypothetical protein [Bacillus halotolerans]UYO33275.1 hypothetical protein NDR85_06865 [Bacillus halotolerans]